MFISNKINLKLAVACSYSHAILQMNKIELQDFLKYQVSPTRVLTSPVKFKIIYVNVLLPYLIFMESCLKISSLSGYPDNIMFEHSKYFDCLICSVIFLSPLLSNFNRILILKSTLPTVAFSIVSKLAGSFKSNSFSTNSNLVFLPEQLANIRIISMHNNCFTLSFKCQPMTLSIQEHFFR